MERGAKYKVTTKDEEFEGIFVSQTEDAYFFKQKSGYNVGIKKDAKIKLLQKPLQVKTSPKKKTKVPQITILHTGGTIASKVDYATGAVSDSFTPEEILQLFPELKKWDIDSILISNMPSDDMNFNHYNIMVDAITQQIKRGVKGIILTHGTDTLHYTAAALSFCLQNLQIPVVIVGSQRSSDRPSSDAANNLIAAVNWINQKMPGVFVCMHNSLNDNSCDILEGTNIMKLHSSRRDAFKSLTGGTIATITLPDKIKIHRKLKNTKKFSPTKFNPKIKVGILKARPGLKPEEFDIYKKYDGLILEGTGLGHFPITKFDSHTEDNKKVFEKIKELAKKIPIAMTTQTVYGRINLNVYRPGRHLKNEGILGHNLAMSTETAYIKLVWLLSNHKKDVKKLYASNLVGEINSRSTL